ncbi:MAG: hypothetical protein QG622_3614 [Actinomycetota bacterium]|nr:hypothetical protein [Actinomycetota bacterium]
MTLSRRVQSLVPRSRGRRRLTTGVGAVLTVGLLVSVASIASAEEVPTSKELMEKCGKDTDFCEFHISGPARAYLQTAGLAAQTANCTGSTQDASLTWEKSTSSSNSFGWSLKVMAGAAKAFQLGFKVAYQHEWTDTLTDRDTTKMTIPGGHMGRVFHAREMEEVSGKYEMHFGSRYYGHYYWYLPMTVNSPKGGGNDKVTTKSEPMTEQERAQFCA